MMKSMVLLGVVLSSSACFELALPFEGAGFEGGGKLKDDVPEGTYLVSTTWIDLKDTDEAQRRFDALMEPLREQLKTQPGLVGYSLAFKPFSNADYRTLTIWESEEAMLQWVVSDDHVAAIAESGDIGADGAVTTWTATRAELPPTFDEARARLDEDGRKLY
jgi:heme-degrading monooxygenase HmoA